MVEYDVFLSFSSKDEDIAKPIWQELSQSGLRVFWSDESLKIKIGESFFTIIQSSLSLSNHFVLICSNNTWNSKWVREEYETFFSQYYIPSDRNRKLIIYKTNQCESSDIPPFLKNIQTTMDIKTIVDVVGGVNINKLKEDNERLKKQLKEKETQTTELSYKLREFERNSKKLEENEKILVEMHNKHDKIARELQKAREAEKGIRLQRDKEVNNNQKLNDSLNGYKKNIKDLETKVMLINKSSVPSKLPLPESDSGFINSDLEIMNAEKEADPEKEKNQHEETNMMEWHILAFIIISIIVGLIAFIGTSKVAIN